MIHRNLDSSNDWTFGRGIQNYTRDLDAVKINIKTRLQSWKSDCFFALTEGVDYNNLLDVGTKSLLDSDIKRVILQSEGVLRITSFESELDRTERGFSAEAEVDTIYGITTVSI